MPQEKGVVDLQPLFFRLTLDTTTALLLGKSVYSLRADDTADAEDKAFADGFNTAQEGLAERFRIAPWHFLYNPPKFRRACAIVHRFVDNYIQQRDFQLERNSDADPYFGFINQVAQESGNDTMLRDQLINVLLAGRDTTACCLSWTMYVPQTQILR